MRLGEALAVAAGAVILGVTLLCLIPSSAGAFSKAVWGAADRNGVNQFPIYR